MIKLKSLLKEIEYPLASKKDLHSYEGMEGWKGKLIWMAPDQFLKLVHPIPDWDTRPESSANIEHRMKNNLPLDFLVLSVDMKTRKVVGHEGRHRATIAKKLGINKVPVLVFTGSGFKRVPQWNPEDHSTVDNVGQFRPEWSKQ